MAGAVVDLIEDDEYAVVVEEPPESLVPVIHSLIGVRGPHRAEQAVHAPAKHRRKGRAKALDDLA
ncbi:hypothetical protein D3C75_1222720 [compost metagenome]